MQGTAWYSEVLPVTVVVFPVQLVREGRSWGVGCSSFLIRTVSSHVPAGGVSTVFNLLSSAVVP